MKLKIDFSGRSTLFTKDEITTVVSALNDANPLTQGQYQKKFETAFSQYIGTKYCFAVNNGTSALELIAQLCQFNDNDEIIIPSHTFTASAYPFAKKGANIVWADIDLKTRVVNVKTIAQKITSNTKAILVVHLYGYLTDMNEIMELAKKKNIIVIEDAAQAIGTEIDGKQAGTFGDFGMYSFHSHKNLTTMGEGGMLVVKDKKFADIIPMLRHNGHCSFPDQNSDYWLPAMGNVDFPVLNGKILWPNNYCIGEIECALGIKLLNRINKINDKKRERAIFFINALKNFPELEMHKVETKRHNYHLLTARLTNGKRDEFIRKMFEEKAIKCVVQYYPLNRYELYKKIGFAKADCPNTDIFFDNMVSFPFQHWLTDKEFDYLLESTKDILNSLRTCHSR